MDYFSKLGFYGTDVVTGFNGVIESVCFDLYGCVAYLLRPGLDSDGKQREPHWFDNSRIILGDQVARVMEPVPIRDNAAGPADKPVR